LASPSGEALPAASAEALDRAALRAWVAVGAAVRERLARLGVDPACARALRLEEAAAARLVGLGDTPEYQWADAAPRPNPVTVSGARERCEGFDAPGRDGLADRFVAKIADAAKRYHDGREPDFADASLAELFAWCLARLADGEWPRGSNDPARALAGGR
jgi:hypothetical protein